MSMAIDEMKDSIREEKAVSIAENLSGAVVTISVGADQRLMSGKILCRKFHSHALGFFTCQAVLLFIPWVEAENIMVGFDFALFLILMEFGIGG